MTSYSVAHSDEYADTVPGGGSPTELNAMVDRWDEEDDARRIRYRPLVARSNPARADPASDMHGRPAPTASRTSGGATSGRRGVGGSEWESHRAGSDLADTSRSPGQPPRSKLADRVASTTICSAR
ncbi:hypothetical protein H4687_002856 [Streptomyces stelliscabiei]|uniref:Uncharacterized protein n=1 Tax=Streptomyces stelliscabiei TaxID=146820 RepID=A0A8I0P3D7_9ACTN|nr:hypothetical protein [Streptomyces stelliscabiei]